MQRCSVLLHLPHFLLAIHHLLLELRYFTSQNGNIQSSHLLISIIHGGQILTVVCSAAAALPLLISSGRRDGCTVCLGWTIFSYFLFLCWFDMLLKSMGESFLLSKDEPLTPNIDGVMALWIFRRRAQTAENRLKLDLSILVFPPVPTPWKKSVQTFLSLELRKCLR